MSHLTVLVGLPGSGKSTRVHEMSEMHPDVFVYSTDNYIEKACKQNGWTYNQGFAEFVAPATKYMNEMLDIAVRSRQDIVWDQTNMSPKKRRGILSRFSNSYRKTCYCIAPPRNDAEWAELDLRLASRKGKTIPHHIVEAMADSYVEPELDEGFDYILIVDIFGKIIAEKVVE